MFDSIKSLIGLRSNSILGVDIGTASIKIVEIAKSSSKPKLKNYGILKTYGHLERPNSAIQTNTLKIAEKETAGNCEITNRIKPNYKQRKLLDILYIFVYNTITNII